MKFIDKITTLAKSQPKRVVLPESNDERILKAARIVKDEGIAIPILIGKESEVAEIAGQHSIDFDGIEIIDKDTSPFMDEVVQLYAKSRDVNEKVARRIAKRDVVFAALLVAIGKADGIVAGVSKPTASIIQAASLAIGLEDGIEIPSSFFIMVFPDFMGEKDKVFIFADSAVAVDPSAEELAGIAMATASNAKRFLEEEPRVAMLSFSTKGSATHARVEKVLEALAVIKEKAPQLNVDGELQLDSAIVERIAKKKAPDSPVAGKANVLIFPDLDSGNIGYKLAQYFGNAQAYGPVMQGFRKPANDLSRGASVEDIVGTITITVIQAANKEK